MLLETLFGIVVTTMYPLTPEYYEYTPPALIARMPRLIVVPTLLFMAIRRSRIEMEQSPSLAGAGDVA